MTDSLDRNAHPLAHDPCDRPTRHRQASQAPAKRSRTGGAALKRLLHLCQLVVAVAPTARGARWLVRDRAPHTADGVHRGEGGGVGARQ